MLASKVLWSFALSLHVSINISVSALPTRECGSDLPDDKDCFTAGTLRIPRERNLSLKDYYEKYEDTQTPVIIEDYASAFAGMSESNIKDVCGARNVSIARRVDAEEGNWANIEWYDHGPLADTWDEIMNTREEVKVVLEGEMIGVFDWALQKQCEELLEKHFIVPKYFAQDYLQRVHHSIDLNYRDSWPSLFIGVDGTYGGTHRDTFGSAFWMYVLSGAKEWVVADSAEDLDFFAPSKPFVRHFHDIVHTGQLLIIPGQRWHQVRNRGNTVTLAGNFVSGRGSFDTMKKEVESDRNTGSYYKQLENTLLVPGFDISIDYNKGDMMWKDFRAQGQGDVDSGKSNELEAATFAVLVSDAGSSEINGCYQFNGRNGDAWQFELINTATGRTFEIFRLDGSAWWNILERVGDSYPNPVHYGVEGDNDDVLPPTNGWGSKEYKGTWLGMNPMPIVEVTNRKVCLSRNVAKRT